MNWDQVAGNWKQFEGKVQSQWGKLTNDDLQQVKGDQKISGREDFRSATASRKRKPSVKSTNGTAGSSSRHRRGLARLLQTIISPVHRGVYFCVGFAEMRPRSCIAALVCSARVSIVGSPLKMIAILSAQERGG